MMDIESFADATLGGAIEPDTEGQNETAALADDVARYDAWRADRDQLLGLEPVGRIDEEQFADAATFDPSSDELDSRGHRTVPLAALHQERAKRQELATRNTLTQQALAQLEQQLEQQIAQLGQPQAQQHAEPPFAEDPRAYIEQRERQFAEQLGQVQQQLNGQRIQAEITQVRQFADQAEAQVRAEVGEDAYAGAVQAVMQHAANALRAAAAERGASLSDAELQQALAVGLHQQIIGCAQRGLNPARQIVERARQLGFRVQRQGAELDSLWQQGAAENLLSRV